MVPMGFELNLSPTEQAVLLTVLLTLAACVALPATLTLAFVGAARARRHGYPGTRNAIWYWLWGTALTLTTMYAGLNLGLSWLTIPAAWLPTLTLAYLLHPRRGSAGTTTPRASYVGEQNCRGVGE